MEDRINNLTDWRLPLNKKAKKGWEKFTMQHKGQFTLGWQVTGNKAASKQVQKSLLYYDECI